MGRKTNSSGRGPKKNNSGRGQTTAKATASGVTQARAKAVKDGLAVGDSVETTESPETVAAKLQAVIAAYDEATKAAKHTRAEAAHAKVAAEKRERSADGRIAATDERDTTVTERENALKRERTKLGDDRSALKAERKELTADEDRLRSTQSALIKREEAIRVAEANAEAGFIVEHERALKTLDEKRVALIKELEALSRDLEDERSAHLMRIQEVEAAQQARLTANEDAFLAKLTAESDARRADREAAMRDLTEREQALEERSREVDTKAREAHWTLANAQELEADVKAHIETTATRKAESIQHDLDQVRITVDDLRTRLDAADTQIAAHREAERRLGHDDPAVVRRRLDAQAEEIQSLKTDLSQRPTAAEAEELDGLRAAREAWADERRVVLANAAELERKLAHARVGVTEVETLQTVIAAKESSQRALEGALEELRTDVETRLDGRKDQPVFPELTKMEAAGHSSRSAPSRLFPERGAELNLVRFASELRHRLAHDPDTGVELYYEPKEIRAFLGGLAMSRLHLLQGISGIGKSSLPRRFAKAVGGGCAMISVQAGWRDRQDLFGHYNTFERRYYESDLVQALAKAQSPRWRDRPIFVLLDEMNLSHPEQYAADILDVLERNDPRTRRFSLMQSQQVGSVPDVLEEGRFLPLPENVWFIGTANHDETTKDFADKTYDRAFVLELPDTPIPFPVMTPEAQEPLRLSALETAFDTASTDHESDAKTVMDWMNRNLSDLLKKSFRIGWGGRLNKQLHRFVPVVVAAGGTQGEALDQMLATRVLRKLQGRYDLDVEALKTVDAVLREKWTGKTQLTASLAVVRGELQRLGAR